MKPEISIEGYTVEKLIGSGGAGEVFLAKDLRTDSFVAIKTLTVESTLNDATSGLKRFFDEASAAGQVDSPYVVKALAHGTSGSGIPYIVYEYLDGGNLEENLCRYENAPYSRMYRQIIQPLLLGLAALHKQGIVHRDIKPENLFKSSSGTYKIGDCGLSIFAQRAAKTKTGMLVGTPVYMSPERLRQTSSDTGPAADIYSAGLVIVKVLTGKLPGVSTSSSGLHFLLDIDKDKLSRTGLHNELVPVIAKALSPDPSDRYNTAEEFLQALPRKLPKINGGSEQKTLMSEERTVLPLQLSKEKKVYLKPSSRRRTVIATLSVLFLACVALVSFRFSPDETSDTSDTDFSYAWLQRHSQDHPLFQKAVVLRGWETSILDVHRFILEEGQLFETAKREGATKEHLKTLSNIERCLSSDRIFHKIIRALYFLRKDNRKDTLLVLNRAFNELTETTPELRFSTSLKLTEENENNRVQLATYLFKHLICIAAGQPRIQQLSGPYLLPSGPLENTPKITPSFSREVLELSTKLSMFCQNRPKPETRELHESLLCARQMSLLSRLLYVQPTDTITQKTTKTALKAVTNIPPYKPTEVFGDAFFRDVVRAFNASLPIGRISWTDQKLQLSDLMKSGSHSITMAKRTFSRIRDEMKRTYFKDFRTEKIDKKDELLALFQGFEEGMWNLITANDLSGWSRIQCTEASRGFDKLSAFSHGFITNPGLQEVSQSVSHVLPEEFRWHHIEKSLLLSMHELLQTDTSLYSQGKVYEQLMEIVPSGYKTTQSKISVDQHLFLSCYENTFPLAVKGVILYFHKELGRPPYTSADFTPLIRELYEAFDKNPPQAWPTSQLKTFPPGWINLGCGVFSARWYLLYHEGNHKQRLAEATELVRFIRAHTRFDAFTPVEFVWDDERVILLKLFLIALCHRADAYLAIHGDYSEEIQRDFVLFPDNDPRETTLWKDRLTKKKRIEEFNLRIPPLEIQCADGINP